MTEKIFQVSGVAGGYANLMDWGEASGVAQGESMDGSFRIIEDTVNNKIVAIYFHGDMFVSAGGKCCEHCGIALNADQAHYAYVLTDHYFCSIKCGKAIGVLSDRI
jgi:hypothetical protein